MLDRQAGDFAQFLLEAYPRCFQFRLATWRGAEPDLKIATIAHDRLPRRMF
jgi:hypothetical protein